MVEKILGDDAVKIAESVKRVDCRFWHHFKEAFTQEYQQGPAFMPQSERTYYVISYNGRKEALLAVTYNLNKNPEKAAVSLSRLFPKDDNMCSGWKYLLEFITTVLRRSEVTVLLARLKTAGGRRAFQVLQEKYPHAVTVEEQSAIVKVDDFPISAKI